MLWNAILCTLVFWICLEGQFAPGGNNYKVEITRITECPDYPNSKIPSPVYARYSRYNRTQKVLNSNYTLSVPMDKKFAITGILHRWGDGGWKTVVNCTLKNACRQFHSYFSKLWMDFLIFSNVKNADKCPLPRGIYHTENYIVPTQYVTYNFFIGSFRLKIVLSRESVIHTCVIFYFNTVENYN